MLEARAGIEPAHKGFADLCVEGPKPSMYAGPACCAPSFGPTLVRPPVLRGVGNSQLSQVEFVYQISLKQQRFSNICLPRAGSLHRAKDDQEAHRGNEVLRELHARFCRDISAARASRSELSGGAECTHGAS